MVDSIPFFAIFPKKKKIHHFIRDGSGGFPEMQGRVSRRTMIRGKSCAEEGNKL